MSQVLALKYRPKKFQDLIGQDAISITLSLALDSDRLSHAYLFSGLRGSGKTSTARIMAKALVCDQGPTSKPCEICDNCKSANEYKHLDIVEMDAASNRGIDDIKDLIEHTKYKPSSARYKIFIIDEVHMLTTSAFNALLKTLEEPPLFVKFILATTDALKLPVTILSRTQHFRFKRIPHQDVVHHLSHILNIENIPFENEALKTLSLKGEGSLRDTLTLLDQAIIFSKSNITSSSITEMLGMLDPIFMQKLFDTILSQGNTTTFLSELESYDAGQVIDEITIFLKYKMLSNDPKFTTILFDRFFRILGDAKQLLSINSDSGFVLILTISKMIEATNLNTIDEVIQQIQNIEVESISRQTPTPSKPKVDTLVSNDDLYGQVIDKVYEKSHKLGLCFEQSFTFNSYINNKLLINSKAKDECRKQLFKYISFIKECIREVYGEDTDIDFKKVQTNDIQNMTQSSGCVAVITDVPKPTLSQQEVTMDDVLNSPMVQKAVELFQPETSLRVNNKV
ncbi:DNA polymerase III subunits gamma and tau [hydrothermal vent metagenome]|uniref:DNA-directed DNA polymerase n=1 Tax=hydrothermal vent metagenome TaxID=652676 RepID=A0A3B1DRB6_9ZZZZ